MIALSQETISEYFTIATSENSWFTEPTNVYNFVNRNSKELLVTIGDSWTWGSDLSLNNSNDQSRVRLVFGNVLAEQIDVDWLNLAIPAQGNFYITAMVRELANLIPHLSYKKITVICTFTGVGRWFNTGYDLDINYIQWFNQHIRSQQDFNKLLFMLNDVCVSRILDYLKSFSHVKLKVGTNFVESLGFDRLRPDQILQEPWYRVLGLSDVGKVYTCLYYDRLSMVTEFLKSKYHADFKKWFLDLTEITNRRFDLILSAPDFRNGHPLESGHQAWSDYIFENL